MDHIRHPASRGVAQGSPLFLARLLADRARAPSTLLSQRCVSRETPQRLPTAQARAPADGSGRCRSPSTCLSHWPMRFQLVKIRVATLDRVTRHVVPFRC